MGEGQGEPWLEYEKRPLPRGFTHPLGQSEVRDALTAAGVFVGRFGRSGSHGQNWWDMEAVALHAHRYGDDVARAWGPHDPVEQVGLAVPGCPSELKPQVRAALLGAGLPRAIEWLAGLRDRGDGWLTTTHRFEVLWRNGTLTFEKDQSHPSLWRTETQGPGLTWRLMP